MIRATYGATASTRVSTGRMRTSGWSHGRVPGGTGLIAGNQWKTVVANRMTRITATTNSGNAASSSIELDVTVSNAFSRRSAAQEPMAMEIGMLTTAASMTRTPELISRSPSTSDTG